MCQSILKNFDYFKKKVVFPWNHLNQSTNTLFTEQNKNISFFLVEAALIVLNRWAEVKKQEIAAMTEAEIAAARAKAYGGAGIVY